MTAAARHGQGLDEMVGLAASAAGRGLDELLEMASEPAYTPAERAQFEAHARAYAAEFSAARIREARQIAKRHGCSMRRGRGIPGFQLTRMATAEVVGGPRSKAAMLTPGDVAKVLGELLSTEDVLWALSAALWPPGRRSGAMPAP